MGQRVHSGLGQTGRRGVVPTMLLGYQEQDYIRTGVYYDDPLAARKRMEEWQRQMRETTAAKLRALAAGVPDTGPHTTEQWNALRKEAEAAKATAAQPATTPTVAAAGPGIFDQLSAWGNQQMIPGIPNLYLAGGGLLAVMAMSQKRRA